MCVNKQLKAAGAECRESKGECDLAEYCNGADPVCPSDVYRRNTDNCTLNEVCQNSVLSASYTLSFNVVLETHLNLCLRICHISLIDKNSHVMTVLRVPPPSTCRSWRGISNKLEGGANWPTQHC